MSVGTAVTKAMVDSEIAALGVSINALFDRAKRLNTFLLSVGSASLQSAPYGYSAGDAAVLLAAAADLDRLRQVYAGLMYVTSGGSVNAGTPTANDGTHFGYPFALNADKCCGFGY